MDAETASEGLANDSIKSQTFAPVTDNVSDTDETSSINFKPESKTARSKC